MELNTDFLVRTFFLALGGIPVTLAITIVTLAVSIPCAFVISMTRIYRVRFLRAINTVYVSFIRGTPVVLQILIVYSLLPSLLNALAKKNGWHINVFDLNPIWYAFVVFSLNTTAILSEVFRSALLTVDRGQMEAALSAGLSPAQAYRRIVVPQALVVALPNMCNATINLIKSTSLAFLMTVKDVTAIARIEASYGYNYVEAYLDIFVIYILVCVATQYAFGALERKLGIYRASLVSF
jgi:L-cystine transport system permease protein